MHRARRHHVCMFWGASSPTTTPRRHHVCMFSSFGAHHHQQQHQHHYQINGTTTTTTTTTTMHVQLQPGGQRRHYVKSRKPQERETPSCASPARPRYLRGNSNHACVAVPPTRWEHMCCLVSRGDVLVGRMVCFLLASLIQHAC